MEVVGIDTPQVVKDLVNVVEEKRVKPMPLVYQKRKQQNLVKRE